MRLPFTIFIAAASLAACANPPTQKETSVDDHDIIGGVAAKSASLDAIGALGWIFPDGSFHSFCTGTLIGPRLVLTAKHCAGETGSISFGIGENNKAPKRIVKVARSWVSPINEGGFIRYGVDVAVMTLEESIDDVTPLPIVDEHVGPSLLGKRVSAVGYGVRDVAWSSGLRRAGSLTIRSTGGKYVQDVFASADALVDFARTEGGGAFAPRDEDRLRSYWEQSLLEEHEVFTGLAPGDVQPCSGDSGGPLVARIDGGLGVLGVVSGSFKLSNASVNPCSVLGEVYATLPADVQTMIDEASDTVGPERPTRFNLTKIRAGKAPALPASTDGSRCGDVPVAGVCNEHAVLRCISESEGPPRLTHIDCALLMQTCRAVDGPGGPIAECVDP